MEAALLTHDFYPVDSNQVVALSSLKIGDRAIVQAVRECSLELRSKLLSMGLVAGQPIEVLHFAPFGDPMTIRLLGFQLALRLSEAEQVLVEVN